MVHFYPSCCFCYMFLFFFYFSTKNLCHKTEEKKESNENPFGKLQANLCHKIKGKVTKKNRNKPLLFATFRFLCVFDHIKSVGNICEWYFFNHKWLIELFTCDKTKWFIPCWVQSIKQTNNKQAQCNERHMCLILIYFFYMFCIVFQFCFLTHM